MTRPTAAVWALAGLAVAAMVVAELTRPVAADVTPAVASTYLDGATIARAEAFRGPLRVIGLLALALRAGAALLAVRWVVRRDGATDGAGRSPRGLRHLGRLGLAGATVWALTDLVRLPLALIVWRRSVEVGLSTRDLGGWTYDYLVQVVPYWIGVGIAVAAGAWLLARAPRIAGPLGGLVGGAIGVGMIVISPLVFEPLLLSFTPLPEQPLRTAILDVADRAGVPDPQVLVADASRRTTASNAYVSGIGTTRRIVLYDTLLRDAPDDQVLAVVAHELAHDRNADLERTAVQLVGVTTLLGVAVQVLLGRRLVDPAGHVTTSGVVQAVALVVVLLVVLGPVERWSSRRTEAAADATALTLLADDDGYRAMLAGLARRNLADPDPPTWATVLFASHPPMGERVARTQDPHR